MRTPSRIMLAAAATLGLLTAAATTAPAAVLTYDLSFEYTGSQSPVGAPPWLRATFDDGGSAGSVNLTLTALNLTGSEFVNDWYFNLDPALNPADLNFAVQSTTGTFANPNVLLAANALNAGGGTDFDIQVDFDNAPPDNRFGPGESITFQITGIPTLTANSFNFLSVPGGQGPFPTVAQVQGIGPTGDDSGWVTIPEPSALGLLGAGALLLARRRR